MHLTVGSHGPPPPWPLAAFSSLSAQWCSVNTTPSRGSARQLRRFTGVWLLEPARERFRRWMKTRVACPPYQLECSCQTTKALSLSRAPYSPLLSPDWVKVCLVSTIVFLPVSIIRRVEKCLGLSVGNRVPCLRSPTAGFCKSVRCFISCQSHMSRHPLEGHWKLSCQLGKGGAQALDHLVYIRFV